MPCELSKTEVVSMGIQRAGWDLPDMYKQQTTDKKVYGYGVWLVLMQDSIFCKNCKTTLHDIEPVNPTNEYLSNASRRVIVDTLQENITRYYAGAPLIPLHFLINSLPPPLHDEDTLTPIGSGFLPNFYKTITKEKCEPSLFYKDLSNKEIRLIYKLMEEVPNETIKQIMRETVFFQEFSGYDTNGEKTFVNLLNPWDCDEQSRAAWNNRERTDKKLSYSQRDTPLPAWLNAIMEFEQTYNSPSKHYPRKPF